MNRKYFKIKKMFHVKNFIFSSEFVKNLKMSPLIKKLITFQTKYQIKKENYEITQNETQ